MQYGEQSVKEGSVYLENVRFRWKNCDFAPMSIISGLETILKESLEGRLRSFCYQPQNMAADSENREL